MEPFYIIGYCIGAVFFFLILRLALSIPTITRLLEQQRDLMLILVEKAKKNDPGSIPMVSFEGTDNEVLNSLRATKLQELKKKWEAGAITEAEYRKEGAKIR